jgi:hypothetical protein
MAIEGEYAARLAGVSQGPWRKKGDEARAALAPPQAASALIDQAGSIDLERLAQTSEKAEPGRSATLRQTLRWHGTGAGITSQEEIKVRDSLDYALAHLMVLELAVETGYLPLDLIRNEARHELASLLWSPGAQQFVRYYDYVSIEYLARRLDVRGLRNVEPPPVNPEAGTRFAIFLAQFSDWVEDEALREWLMFLDDYVDYVGEQTVFRSFLKGEGEERSERFGRLLYGIQRFLLSLSNLFGILKPAERARFGLFYSYWMAKFFGYVLKEDGYQPATQESWARIIQEHPAALLPPSADRETAAKFRELFNKQLVTIEAAWDATRELVAASASSKN